MRKLFGVLVLAVVCLAQEAADPWAKAELIEPAALVEALHSATPPVVMCTAFSVLYRSKRIPHAIEAGPGSKPEGIDLLKKAAADLPKDADIVLYCGCCPMVKCPNIRPAYRALREMGFQHVRVLNIPTNNSNAPVYLTDSGAVTQLNEASWRLTYAIQTNAYGISQVALSLTAPAMLDISKARTRYDVLTYVLLP